MRSRGDGGAGVGGDTGGPAGPGTGTGPTTNAANAASATSAASGGEDGDGASAASDDGCGCAVPGTSAPEQGALLATALAFFLTASRRARRVMRGRGAGPGAMR